MQTRESEYLHSSLREKILEHLFVGEILKSLWLKKIFDVELLRSEVDNVGYDIVISCKRIVRYIQLKASTKEARTSRQKINISLCEKPGGCVIWMQFDAGNLQLGPFLWLGGKPGEQLDIQKKPVAKHTKGNANGTKLERHNVRVLNKGDFKSLATIDDVIFNLFPDLFEI